MGFLLLLFFFSFFFSRFLELGSEGMSQFKTTGKKERHTSPGLGNGMVVTPLTAPLTKSRLPFVQPGSL